MIHLSDEPLWPYLFEIALQPESESAILTGGLGLRLKRAFLEMNNHKMLLPEVPELRATSDLDLLLRMHLWTEVDPITGDKPAKGFRQMLISLGYEDALQSWNFKKDFEGIENKFVILDLQARMPKNGEKVNVRDGQVGRGMKVNLSGLATPEAFAVDDSPIEIRITNSAQETTIHVPHPYAWLNLKVAAANDWHLEVNGKIEPKKPLENGDSRRLKHVFDVYPIVGMMTAEELSQAEEIARNYADHPKAMEIRDAAKDLYGSRESIGSQAVRTYNGGAWAEHFNDNYGDFWDALSQALGIS